jgi:hypothetical protein
MQDLLGAARRPIERLVDEREAAGPIERDDELEPVDVGKRSVRRTSGGALLRRALAAPPPDAMESGVASRTCSQTLVLRSRVSGSLRRIAATVTPTGRLRRGSTELLLHYAPESLGQAWHKHRAGLVSSFP